VAGGGYDTLATSASNLGPESIVDMPGKPSLLTQVCSRSLAVAEREGLGKDAGARPFCTADGVGAVLSVIGPRNDRGNVVKPTRVVSINQSCETAPRPFLNIYEGVRVECAKYGEDYSVGQIVPIRGAAPADPAVPADAVTASGSGLDPDISVTYADLQIGRIAKARNISDGQVRQAVRDNQGCRVLGFLGEPRVNVLQLNLELDRKYPVKS
jgi:K+-transporting ATPase ATPase C chain